MRTHPSPSVVIACCALLATVFASAALAAVPATPAQDAAWTKTAYAQINAQRVANGLAPLTADKQWQQLCFSSNVAANKAGWARKPFYPPLPGEITYWQGSDTIGQGWDSTYNPFESQLDQLRLMLLPNQRKIGVSVNDFARCVLTHHGSDSGAVPNASLPNKLLTYPGEGANYYGAGVYNAGEFDQTAKVVADHLGATNNQDIGPAFIALPEGPFATDDPNNPNYQITSFTLTAANGQVIPTRTWSVYAIAVKPIGCGSYTAHMVVTNTAGATLSRTWSFKVNEQNYIYGACPQLSQMPGVLGGKSSTGKSSGDRGSAGSSGTGKNGSSASQTGAGSQVSAGKSTGKSTGKGKGKTAKTRKPVKISFRLNGKSYNYRSFAKQARITVTGLGTGATRFDSLALRLVTVGKKQACPSPRPPNPYFKSFGVGPCVHRLLGGSVAPHRRRQAFKLATIFEIGSGTLAPGRYKLILRLWNGNAGRYIGKAHVLHFTVRK